MKLVTLAIFGKFQQIDFYRSSEWNGMELLLDIAPQLHEPEILTHD